MVVDVPYVDLPMIGLKGEWTIAEPERPLAASLMATIPPAPGPDADVLTRWNAAYGMLAEIRDLIRDNGKSLFGDRASVTEVPGKVEMLSMLWAAARVINEGDFWLHVLHRGDAKSESSVAGHLDELEPELARLRDLLVEAAGPLLTEKADELVTAGMALWRRGDREDAVLVTRRGVGALRHLAIADPRTSHLLATALSNLGGMLEQSGRPEQAIPVLEQSVTFRRLFADKSPEFTADLATSLGNLGRALTTCGLPDKATEVLEESVETYRGLVEGGASEYRAALASSLNSLGNARGLDTAARRDFDEAIALLRELDPEHADDVATLLASTLTSMCGILLHVGDGAAAVANSAESVALFRRVGETNPAGVAPYLAKALVVWAEALHAIGRPDEALTTAEEAIGIVRAAAETNPEGWRTMLADSLRLVATLLTALGQRRQAAAASAEAARLAAGESLEAATTGKRSRLLSRLRWPRSTRR
jgi:tetratricopeptide (TPR) repeat protein